jgi:hypothetical protein
MNQMTIGMTEEAPPVFQTYNIAFPGLPFTTLLNTIVLLLNAYGVRHQVPYDENFVGDGLDSGNPSADSRFQNDYMMFKMFLDGLSREYRDIHCGIMGTAIGAHMTFTCR